MIDTRYYWKLRDIGETEPWALMSSADDDFRARRFVPGEGWVDWPGLSMYLFKGEPSADLIDESQARKWMAKGLGKIGKEFVDSARGPSPTIKA